MRHRFTTMLGIAMCAVLAGETSYAAIAECAADLPPAVRLRLGIGRQPPPSESSIRRDLQHIDHDQLDRVVSGWPAGRARATAHPGAREDPGAVGELSPTRSALADHPGTVAPSDRAVRRVA